jgi:hypothetical protein
LRSEYTRWIKGFREAKEVGQRLSAQARL